VRRISVKRTQVISPVAMTQRKRLTIYFGISHSFSINSRHRRAAVGMFLGFLLLTRCSRFLGRSICQTNNHQSITVYTRDMTCIFFKITTTETIVLITTTVFARTVMNDIIFGKQTSVDR